MDPPVVVVLIEGRPGALFPSIMQLSASDENHP